MPADRTVVVLPAFNEAPVIDRVVREIRARHPEVVVVDDGSTDGTGRLARAAGAVVARHPINRGQGAALQTGIELALARGACVIVTFDADGQHAVADIARLVEPIAAGRADVALGSRFAGSGSDIPRARRWLLRLATLFTRLLSRVDVTDAHNGLRAFSRHAARGIRIRMDRMAHASELLDQIRQQGLVYVEVPVTVRYTAYSMSKGQHGAGAVRILLDYVLGRWLS